MAVRDRRAPALRGRRRVRSRPRSADPDAVEPVAWDRAVCARCSMLVGASARFAAQLQTEDGTVLDFDDPGCLLELRARATTSPSRAVVPPRARGRVGRGRPRRGLRPDDHDARWGTASALSSGHARRALDGGRRARRRGPPPRRRPPPRDDDVRRAPAPEVTLIARLELGEVRRSRWMVLAAALYVLLAGIFVVDRDARVGGHRLHGHEARAPLPLPTLLVLAAAPRVVATWQAVNRARDDGTLELLLSQPLSRGGYLVGDLGRALPGARGCRCSVLLPALGLVGELLFGRERWHRGLHRARWRRSVVAPLRGRRGGPVRVDVRAQPRECAHDVLLVLWAAGVALSISPSWALMLQWSLNPKVVFALAAVNPVQCGAPGAALGPPTPELSTLGPVGFYLATRIGPRGLVALGSCGRRSSALTTWGVAPSRFRRGDLRSDSCRNVSRGLTTSRPQPESFAEFLDDPVKHGVRWDLSSLSVLPLVTCTRFRSGGSS